MEMDFFFSLKFVLKAEKIEEIPETSDVKEEFTWNCFPATTGQKKKAVQMTYFYYQLDQNHSLMVDGGQFFSKHHPRKTFPFTFLYRFILNSKHLKVFLSILCEKCYRRCVIIYHILKESVTGEPFQL